MKKLIKNPNKRDAILVLPFFILFAIIFTSMNAQSQNRLSGFSIQTSLSGSGMGAGFQIAADLELGNSVLSLGPVVQFRNGNFSGARFDYRYYLNYDSGKRTTLFFSGTAHCHKAAFLSLGTIDRENMIFPENGFDYANMRISVLELNAGFGIKCSHTSFLSSVWNIGVGTYLSTEQNTQYKEMYRDANGASLFLSMGFRFTFGALNQNI